MEKKKRSTPLKKEIIDLLRQFHFLSAPQIVEKLHARGHLVNKSSVYRTLDSFLEDDIICQQIFADESVYELQHDHHDHLYCSHCGKVEKITCAVKTPKTIQGFQVEHHHLTMYGVCTSCQSVVAQ